MFMWYFGGGVCHKAVRKSTNHFLEDRHHDEQAAEVINMEDSNDSYEDLEIESEEPADVENDEDVLEEDRAEDEAPPASSLLIAGIGIAIKTT
ncbi:hypothetical protein AX17_004060 [Amanita inopinata Kibby_2008]|nr:hypothetical protein AX17_004060 [Amanita inopinata Kibby_2008]